MTGVGPDGDGLGGDVRNRDVLGGSRAREVALECVEAGIEAAHPRTVVAEVVTFEGDVLRVAGASYDLEAHDEVVVLGGGTAGGHVAAALEAILGERLSGGVVVTDDSVPTDRVEVVEGAHPLPDGAGREGARRVLERAQTADEGTLVLAVVAGGGSALLPAPAGDLALEDLRVVTEDLVSAGAPVEEINAVRKHCSAIEGGQLVRAVAPGTVVGLVFSDVVGDDLAAIASGPTAPDGTSYPEALGVLDEFEVEAPAVRAHLERGVDGDHPETPTHGDPAFGCVDNHVLANAWTAIEAARRAARERGFAATVLSSTVTGEAREAVLEHLAAAENVAQHGTPVEPPAVVVSGGETTMAVRGTGTGGPNQEFGLAAALGLLPSGDDASVSLDGVTVAAVDTDGRDGGTDAAGALVDPTTVDDPASARAALDDNDAYPYLDARDALVFTGRTGTNVNDLRVVVVAG
jgi:hydroxypyruvate reductase